MATEKFAGPLSFLVFAFDRGVDCGPGLESLLEAVEQGRIEILDIEFIARDDAGSPVEYTFPEGQEPGGVDLAEFTGANSRILDAEDLGTVAAVLTAGQFAIAVVYEDRSLAAAASAWSAGGGVEVLSGGIDVVELEHLLETEV